MYNLPQEGHDFGINKRMAVYDFFASVFNLDKSKLDEKKVTIEPQEAMFSFGNKGELMLQRPSARSMPWWYILIKAGLPTAIRFEFGEKSSRMGGFFATERPENSRIRYTLIYIITCVPCAIGTTIILLPLFPKALIRSQAVRLASWNAP
jgi:hypothetical protein